MKTTLLIAFAICSLLLSLAWANLGMKERKHATEHRLAAHTILAKSESLLELAKIRTATADTLLEAAGQRKALADSCMRLLTEAAQAEGFGADAPLRQEFSLLHASIGAITNVALHPDHIEVNGREGSRRWF